MDDLRRCIRDVPDFPRKGIVFKDIMPLLNDHQAFARAVELMSQRAPRPEGIVAIESRGFVFGTALALHWRVPLVLARKFGKLPGKCAGRHPMGVSVPRSVHSPAIQLSGLSVADPSDLHPRR